jgi:acetolactate synthase-1/2/3 large subunit
VVSVNGDGCFLMCGQELATAARYDARVIFLIVDNGVYGTIRMHQERDYPGRVSGTDLSNPDFVQYAKSFGALGLSVEHEDEFPEAFAKAKRARRPAVIVIRGDSEAIAPGRRLSEMGRG